MSAIVDIPHREIMSVEAMTSRINAIQQVTQAKMKADVHYGVIPGTKKPTLYKAGSEMLLTMFAIGCDVEVVDLSTPGKIKYRVIVTGIHTPTGTRLGQGVGECSSGEEKYQWRNAVCDEEFEAAPENMRRVKFNRGRGGSFYTSQQVRVSAEDMSNTVLKMAKKRAQIDMTLTALGVSDLFNQDIEDLPAELRPAGDDVGDREHPQSPGLKEASATSEAQLRAAKSVPELAKVFNAIPLDERKPLMAIFNRRRDELRGAAK